MHSTFKTASIALVALFVNSPFSAHANSELLDVFGSALGEKKATKSPDGVTVSGEREAPVDGTIALPSGWKRIELVFGPQSGSSTNILNTVDVALGFFDSQAAAEKVDAVPVSGVSVEMRQLHSRMKSSEPNTKVVILGQGGQKAHPKDLLVEGADAWFPIYSGRKDATPFRVVVERASADAKSGKVTVTDPSGAEAAAETIEFPKTPGAARIRITTKAAEGQSLSVRFPSLTVK